MNNHIYHQCANATSILKRNVLSFVAATAIGLSGATWFVMSQPRIYEAISVIQIKNADVSHASSITSADMYRYLDSIQQKMFARDNLISLAEQQNLVTNDVNQMQIVDQLRNSISITRLIDSNRAWHPDVQPYGLSVSVRMNDPLIVANVANTIANQIVYETEKDTRDRSSQTLEFLISEELRVSNDLEKVEEDIVLFKEENIDSIQEFLVDNRRRINSLADMLSNIDNEIIRLQTSNRIRVEDAERQLLQLSQHRELIEEQRNQVLAAIAISPMVSRTLSTMYRNRDALVEELSMLTSLRTEAAVNHLIMIQNQSTRFEILEAAIAPLHSVSMSRTKMLILGIVIVIISSFGLIFIIDAMNSRIRTINDLQKLGIVPTIVVPRVYT